MKELSHSHMVEVELEIPLKHRSIRLRYNHNNLILPIMFHGDFVSDFYVFVYNDHLIVSCSFMIGICLDKKVSKKKKKKKIDDGL